VKEWLRRNKWELDLGGEAWYHSGSFEEGAKSSLLYFQPTEGEVAMSRTRRAGTQINRTAPVISSAKEVNCLFPGGGEQVSRDGGGRGGGRGVREVRLTPLLPYKSRPRRGAAIHSYPFFRVKRGPSAPPTRPNLEVGPREGRKA